MTSVGNKNIESTDDNDEEDIFVALFVFNDRFVGIAIFDWVPKFDSMKPALPGAVLRAPNRYRKAKLERHRRPPENHLSNLLYNGFHVCR